MPGNVLLDMTRVLELLKDDPRADRQSIRKLLLSLVLNNYLAVDLLQSWLQSHFSRALDAIASRMEMNGIKLRYKTCGPAHTVVVEGRDLEYSVDYVPAIRLGAEQNVLAGEELTYFRRANLSYWDAIPKPLKTAHSPAQVSFRSSFYEAEKAMLRGGNMSSCLDGIKLIKKFRDVKTNLSNLKSYYIKTLFLWKIRQEPAHYWLQPLTVILTDMFDELTECLLQGRLCFYWDPELNMLDVLTRDQVAEMYRCVERFSDVLRREVGSDLPRRTGGSRLVVLRAFSHKQERTPLRASQRIANRKDVKRLQHR
ncbi:hypothetical protein KR054_004465 [Drosophila jambulina]|nr:hypothetical protein KR054_004465 [Drosophila jambulina]